MTGSPIGKRLREVRRKLGVTGRELAERVGSTEPTISRLETGKQAITEEWLSQFAAALNVSVSELMPDAAAGVDGLDYRIALDRLAGAVEPHMQKLKALREDDALVSAYVHAVGILRKAGKA